MGWSSGVARRAGPLSDTEGLGADCFGGRGRRLGSAGSCGRNGRLVTPEMVQTARNQGATDRELHDTVLIAALFSLYHRYVDGLATVTPEDPAFYDRLGGILQKKGYLPSEDRYAGLV